MPGTGNYGEKVGWSVGLESWLNSPASKVNRYWRAQEYGLNFKGLKLIGLWGASAGRNTRPNELRHGQELGAPGESRGQKFVPFGTTHSAGTALKRARFAFWYFITHGRMGRPTDGDLAILHGHPRPVTTKRRGGGDPVAAANRRIFYWMMTKTTSYKQIPFVRAVVLKNIPAHRYYAKTVKAFRPAERELEILKVEIARLMSTAFSTKNARVAMGADHRKGNIGPKTGPRRTEVAPGGAGKYLLQQYGAEVGLGLVTVTSGTALQDNIRNRLGQFGNNEWQDMLRNVNVKMAYEFQLAVAEKMNADSKLRPETFDLAKATMDARNRLPR